MDAMTITEFLEARIAEDEAAAREEDEDYAATTLLPTYDSEHQANWNTTRVLAECAAKRAILKQHEDWPVLSQTEPTFTHDAIGDPLSMTMRASQEIAWLTEREYVRRFGVEAPTAPMIRTLAAVYRDHPGYKKEWA